MKKKHSKITHKSGLSLSWAAVPLLFGGQAMADLDPAEEAYELKLLGKYVFFDKISEPDRMACVTCHDPRNGGTPAKSGINLHQVAMTGANPHTVGGIATPTNIYASLIPPLAECRLGGIGIIDESGNRTRYCGGNFWDGRAEGNEEAFLPGATEHLGEEVFHDNLLSDERQASYANYFGPTSDQALNPMPNPVEQNISRQAVCEQVAASKYAPLYEQTWGEPINCSSTEAVNSEAEFDISFKRLMLAVGAWQASADLNSFSSERDIALRSELACLGETAVEARYDADAWAVVATYHDPAFCAELSAATDVVVPALNPETGFPVFPPATTTKSNQNNWGRFPLFKLSDTANEGHDLFYNTSFPRPNNEPFPDLPVTNCSFCHLSDTAHPDGTGLFERYADDAYHNIGTPVNPELPAAPNPGISGFAASEDGFGSGHAQALEEKGGYKTPPIRNVAKILATRNYTHNGYFKSLERIIHFYNSSAIGNATADSFGLTRCEGLMTDKQAEKANCWPEAEWPATVSASRLVGNIGMTLEQEAAIVEYMKALDDLETPVAPKPYKVKTAASTSTPKGKKK
jgi:cytochrome c peroxidase